MSICDNCSGFIPSNYGPINYQGPICFCQKAVIRQMDLQDPYRDMRPNYINDILDRLEKIELKLNKNSPSDI